jgi:hypothetical protein
MSEEKKISDNSEMEITQYKCKLDPRLEKIDENTLKLSVSSELKQLGIKHILITEKLFLVVGRERNFACVENYVDYTDICTRTEDLLLDDDFIQDHMNDKIRYFIQKHFHAIVSAIEFFNDTNRHDTNRKQLENTKTLSYSSNYTTRQRDSHS